MQHRRTRPYHCAAGIAAGILLLSGCAGSVAQKAEDQPAVRNTIRIDALIASAYWMARGALRNAPAAYQPYGEALFADGRLTVGLGIGTQDLGDMAVPDSPADRICRRTISLFGRSIAVEGRLITTNDEFTTALAECEILFISSHSRFGAGPVFYQDGKAQPYTMQHRKDYEIIMPEEEVSGYHGRVKRAYFDPVRGKQYTVFEPDSADLDAATPLHSYQLIVLSTCTSRKHFLETIRQFRGIYPTTAIFTTRPCCMDTGMEVFKRFLSDIFQGQSLESVVRGMNETYAAVAQRRVRLRIPPWKIIENLYAVGIHTLP